jgi:hypothetical protein
MLSIEGANVEVAYLTLDGDDLATNGIVVTASSGYEISTAVPCSFLTR